MKIIFCSDGGFGKNTMATVPVSYLKKELPESEIYVLASWPQAWTFNPDIKAVHPLGYSGSYELVKDADAYIHVDPYKTLECINNEEHVASIWTRLAFQRLGRPVPADIDCTPTVRLNAAERAYGKMLAGAVVIQPFGGVARQPHTGQTSWIRDMPLPTATALAGTLSKSGHNVLQLKSDSQPLLQGATALTPPTQRHAAAVIAESSKCFLIDSFAQHLAAGVGKRSTVLWPYAPRQKLFGYDSNRNIVGPDVEDTPLHFSGVQEFDITGNMLECPFEKFIDIFDVAEILKEEEE